jgi:hypothetical protein
VAANYPIVRIRRTLERSSQQYRLSSIQVLLLPNFIQVGGLDHAAGSTVRVVRSDSDQRFDQAFPLAMLVDDAEDGTITARDGSIRSTFGGPPAVVNTASNSVTSRSAVIERSTMFNREQRVCSSIMEAILMAFPSIGTLLSTHCRRASGTQSRICRFISANSSAGIGGSFPSLR